MKPPGRTKSGYKEVFFEDGLCIYCGMAAEVKDHALPYSVKDCHPREGRYLVPACYECNALAAASVQHSLSQRIAHVKSKLGRRYAKLLNAPRWSLEELAEMSPMFQAQIMRRSSAATLARDRIAFDYFLWVELGRPKELRM